MSKVKQAVILAAGEGKRLRPHTLHTPKPLLKINGTPILEYTISNLPDSVRDVILVVGYKGEQIRNHFGREFSGRNIHYVFQEKPLGTFHALNCARELLKPEPFLIMVGDDLHKKEDLSELAGHSLSALLHPVERPERFGICKICGRGIVREIIEKPDFDCGNLASTGAFFLDHDIFNEEIVYGPNNEMLLSAMVGSLARKKEIRAVLASFWLPIGYPEDLERAKIYL